MRNIRFSNNSTSIPKTSHNRSHRLSSRFSHNHVHATSCIWSSTSGRSLNTKPSSFTLHSKNSIKYNMCPTIIGDATAIPPFRERTKNGLEDLRANVHGNGCVVDTSGGSQGQTMGVELLWILLLLAIDDM
eukprot:gb/GECH01012520.1/.p1 GENE.gb/GECH01012520.1/~~gb/GECH01012520.1/.p1  ORF type:complete len:131 (+),score=15.78 gb/GECH01012520.1/:1-393(+)